MRSIAREKSLASHPKRRQSRPSRKWPARRTTRTPLIPLPRRHDGCFCHGMVLRLAEFPTAEPFLPERITLPALKKTVQGCRGCPLYKNATQAVFGEGPTHAKVLFIGEQPGDQEDLAGKPFVGPAGKLLNGVLDEVGIDRGDVYVTNAVKHFKWEPRGTRRIHSKPSAREMAACKPWLSAELQVIKPQMVICLG